ncbi:ABC transporter substrate-binding protein [Salarchaeum japonicum]|uniref:ABC transporter substrate-binding protein n=1 Tax=Salarchaeum japonicum TaxID=555573 RepID=A0AAV3T4F8_9EURY|nr:ABC transporter substrate-binding protein [Salarchaeum japonicum]
MDEKYRSRRAFLKDGSALAAAGLLAGCQSGDGTTTESTTETTTESTTEQTTTTTEDASYTVSMEPVGDVTFEEVPESWVPYTGDYADMGVALGQADGLAGIGVPSRYGTHHYAELDGVSVDTESLTTLYQDGTGKEIFYSVDADVHVIDPNFMMNRLQWSQGDVDEISSGVAPFFGNTIFTQVYDWHDYEYYSLYEAFEKLAELFQERERYEAFKAYHDEVVADVQSRIPEETPEIALLYPAGVPPDSFYPYLVGEGTASKQWRDLGVDDALANAGVTDAQAGGATVDYETLLDIDPDAIAVRLSGNISDAYFQENIVSHMEEDEVASRLTAVQDGRVFYGGLTYQGPIIHLFQLETAARGLFPDTFGEDEELFDRGRVSAIVNGEF